MKLLRIGSPGKERPALLADDGTLRDLSGLVSDISGANLSDDTLNTIRNADITALPKLSQFERKGPCVQGIGKFICIGLNYADHAAETGVEAPAEPIIFFKATSAICGPNDDLEIPIGSTKTDWEVELGVVIGKTAKNVSEADALDHVAGYCVVHDVSERAFQLEGTGQWVKGKSADTFGPIGPYLVTRDDVPDPQVLDLKLSVNDTVMQTGNTRTMIFTVVELIAYVSRYMSLQPGDIISTGTPPGVGLGMSPPQYLRVGDVVSLSISGLGEQQQTCRQAE